VIKVSPLGGRSFGGGVAVRVRLDCGAQDAHAVLDRPDSPLGHPEETVIGRGMVYGVTLKQDQSSSVPQRSIAIVCAVHGEDVRAHGMSLMVLS